MIAGAQSGVLRDLFDLKMRHFLAMSRRVDAGEASRADLERVRLDLVDSDRRLREARAQGTAALQALAAVTGLSSVTLSSYSFTWENFDTPEAPAVLDDSNRVTALLARADVLKAVASYAGSEADLRGEIAKQFPAISIGPGYTWERGLVKLPFNIGLVLPPLDLNRRNIAAAEARRAEAGARLEAVVTNARTALEAAELEVAASRAALASARGEYLKVAARLARVADNELKQGAIDRTDWAAAQAGLITTRLAAIDALARAHSADAVLEDAARRPLSGPELGIAGSVR